MPALQRALALAEMDDGAGAVGQDLHLDVAGPLDQAFQEQRVVPERAGRDAARRDEDLGEVLRPVDGVHALAAAARGRLDEQREADVLRGAQQVLVGESRFGDAGDHGDTRGGHVVLRADLVAHDVQGGNGRSDEDDPGLPQCVGEGRVLAELRKPYPGCTAPAPVRWQASMTAEMDR
ncbi:hypothetical protein MN0502_11800 [Arthrobacter sp. MN05-02]|nr:hypothetical protein MN0502_11800 [Arthrobacter sp. MN05-02]